MPCTIAACADVNAIVLSGNESAFNALRMKPSKKWQLSIGGIPAKAHLYHVLPRKGAAGAVRAVGAVGAVGPAVGTGGRSQRQSEQEQILKGWA